MGCSTTPTQPDGTPCGGTDVDCDAVDTCQNGYCHDNFKPADTECRVSTNECRLSAFCTGTSATCPFSTPGEPDGTPCTGGNCVGGVCDAHEGGSKCASKLMSAVAKHSSAILKCHAKALAKAATVDPACETAADGKLSDAVTKAEASEDCLAIPSDAQLKGIDSDYLNAALGAIAP
jgi:hypothetical protein